MESNRVCGVQTSNGYLPCHAVISTIPLPILGKLIPIQKSIYFKNILQIDYIGVICLLLSLDRPLDKNFWTNINDPRIAFNGYIELTNLNQHLRQQGKNLVYIPYYLATSEPRFKLPDEQLLRQNISVH